MKHKVSELEGEQLDAAVCMAVSFQHGWGGGFPEFRPSSDWYFGGPIIERERIAIFSCSDGWAAELRPESSDWIDCDMYEADARGSTPLIAAMRAYVAAKLGEKIDLPDK